MATITKRDLIVRITDRTGLTQNQVSGVMQVFLDEIMEHLANNDEVVLRNFGSFELRTTKPKVGRNPNSPGTTIQIPAKKVVRFRPGKEMKDSVAKLPPEE